MSAINHVPPTERPRTHNHTNKDEPEAPFANPEDTLRAHRVAREELFRQGTHYRPFTALNVGTPVPTIPLTASPTSSVSTPFVANDLPTTAQPPSKNYTLPRRTSPPRTNPQRVVNRTLWTAHESAKLYERRWKTALHSQKHSRTYRVRMNSVRR